MIETPVRPKVERQELDIVVYNVPEGGVDGSELEGEAVLVEETVGLVGGVVLTYRNAVVR